MEMNTLIETIKRAVEPEAAADARHEGAAACRAILATLETEPGHPLPGLPPPSPQPGIAADQLMDLVIARLRAMLPEHEAASVTSRGLNLPLVAVPRGPKGGSQ